MSKFIKFMKANKIQKANEMHPVTASLCDENGKPLDFEFRHITSAENENIRAACTKDVPVTGKPGYVPAQGRYFGLCEKADLCFHCGP